MLRSGAAFVGATIAGLAPGARPAAAEPTRVRDADIQQLVEHLDRERQAWIEGRFDPTSTGPMSQAPDMTIFAPFGGPAGTAGPELHARQQRMSAQFRGGSGDCELVRAIASDDLVILVMLERNQVTFEGQTEARPWTLRTTQVFRRDGNQWIRLHRHADPLIGRRSLDETLLLLEASETVSGSPPPSRPLRSTPAPGPNGQREPAGSRPRG